MAAANWITIKESELEMVEQYSQPGMYDFRHTIRLERIIGGPLAGKWLASDTGFRWQGNTGASGTEYYLVNEAGSAAKLAAALKADDPEEAQRLMFSSNRVEVNLI